LEALAFASPLAVRSGQKHSSRLFRGSRRHPGDTTKVPYSPRVQVPKISATARHNPVLKKRAIKPVNPWATKSLNDSGTII